MLILRFSLYADVVAAASAASAAVHAAGVAISAVNKKGKGFVKAVSALQPHLEWRSRNARDTESALTYLKSLRLNAVSHVIWID